MTAAAALLLASTGLHAAQAKPVQTKPAQVKPAAPPAAEAAPQKPADPADKPAAAAAPAAPEVNWAWRCGSATRTGPMECSLDQTVIKTDTRQIIALFRIRVPGDTREPVGFIQTPLGVFLPAGVELQIDQDQVIQLPIQMCDANGCYAGAPISAEVIGRLQSGKVLRIGFQNVSRETINVTMPLDGFGVAYAAIK